MSIMPPGPPGTMMRSGLVGHASAHVRSAEHIVTNSVAAVSRRRRFIAQSPGDAMWIDVLNLDQARAREKTISIAASCNLKLPLDGGLWTGLALSAQQSRKARRLVADGREGRLLADRVEKLHSRARARKATKPTSQIDPGSSIATSARVE
jgi:hypothetical protein